MRRTNNWRGPSQLFNKLWLTTTEFFSNSRFGLNLWRTMYKPLSKTECFFWTLRFSKGRRNVGKHETNAKPPQNPTRHRSCLVLTVWQQKAFFSHKNENTKTQSTEKHFFRTGFISFLFCSCIRDFEQSVLLAIQSSLKSSKFPDNGVIVAIYCLRN